MNRSRKLSKDARSEAEKVADLCDIFVGDYAVDREVIEAVLDGCDGDVNKSTEKLFEMVSTVRKCKNLEKEENDLAVIACSILTGDNAAPRTDDQSRKLQQSTAIKGRKTPSPEDNVQMAYDIHDHIIGGTSFQDSYTTSYNFYDSSINSKPRSEAKCLFKSEGHSQEFLAKSSFEDMARNMDQNAFVGSKTSGRPFEKDDGYLCVEEGKNSNLPSLKFDVSSTSFGSIQSNLKNMDLVNRAKGNKCSVPNVFDSHSCDPVSSLMSNISPDVSAEWNAFYKELNFEPISNSPGSPEIDICQVVDNSASSDCDKSFVSAQKVKQNLYLSKESEGDTFREGNDSQFGDISYNVFCREEIFSFSGTEFVSLPSHEEEKIRKIKSNNTELKVPLKNYSDNGNKSPFSNEASSTLSVSNQNMAVTTKQSNDIARSLSTDLSPTAPAFIPVRTRYSNMTSFQQRKTAVTPPQPLKLLKVSKQKSTKKKRKQLQLKETSHEPSHNSHKILEQQSENVVQKPDEVYNSSTNEVNNGLHDSFGWGEIENIISSSSSLPTKPQPQRFKKTRASFPNVPSSQTIVPTMSLREDDIKTSPSFVKGNSWRKEEHTALDEPIPKASSPANLSAANSQNSSPLPLISRLWKSPALHQNAGSTEKQSFKDSDSIEVKTSKHLSSRLPPSLAMQPPTLPPSSPLLSSTLSNVPAKSSPMRERNTSLSSSQHTYRNSVQLVGVKTPIGMLRHYIQQGHPVMIILRGLPGSGKSYLARQLMAEIQRTNKKGVVLSTDDYFTRSGEYNFDRNHLSIAHDWNKQRALSSVKEKQVFVIIDNTNTTMWELLPYVKIAIQYQYDVRICEPDTPWKNKVQELTRKNEHGLSKEHIKRMKERYEPLTTEQVLQEAYKSLVATGRLRSMEEDETEETSQLSTDKLENLSSPDEIVTNEAVETGVGDKNKILVNPNLVLSDLTLTGWLPSQEQRKQSSRRKKDLKLMDSNKPCAKSAGPHITVDFLNNSLRKAMVDMDKMARDFQSKDDQTMEEKSCDKMSSSDLSSAFEDIHTKDKSLSINFGLVSGQNMDMPDAPDEEQHDKPNGEKCTKINEPSLSKVNDEFIPCQGRMSDKNLDDNIGGLTSVVSPRDSSPLSFHIENFSSPRLTCSWTSGSFHSCKSEEEEAVSLEDIEDADDFVVGSIEFCGLCEKDDLGSISDVATPVNLVERIVFSSVDERTSESHTEKLFADEILKADIKDKKQTDDHYAPTGVTNNSECAVHRLPPFTGSLVQYDDSEEESEGENPSHSLDVESAEPVKKEGDESFNPMPSVFTDKNDTNAAFAKKSDQEKIRIYEDISQAKDKVKATDYSIDKEPICDSASASLTSSREQSPHPCVDAVSGSPEKAKKKRIRKGRNPAPFLEDSLVTESKSKNWHTFFNQSNIESNHQLSQEIVSAPTERRVGEMISVSVQCEPFYFTMVYKLNSKAFSQEPLDPSLGEVSVLQTSDSRVDDSIEKDFAEIRVARRHNISDQSTMTDETLDTEKIDIFILQNCFPAFSRNYLEEVMSVCGNNLEWVTNHLIDSPPLIDVDGDEENISPEKEEDSEKFSQKSDFPQTSSFIQNSVKSLAHLASDTVKDIAKVDPDDFEIEVIKAGQKRLQLIENFGKERLHSLSHESVMSDNWPNDFYSNYFLGPLTPEECWEWNLSQEVQGRLSNPIFPISPSSPTDSGYWKFKGPPVLSGRDTSQNPLVNFCAPLREEYHAPLHTLDSSPNEKGLTFMPDTNKKEQHLEPAGNCAVEEGNFHQSMTQPLLPLNFIRCLENLYGPLNLDLDNEGLLLEDRIARKIFNCLKLQTTKILRCSPNDEQLKEDEAIARALQEEENARIQGSESSPKPDQGENKVASKRRVNSVSHTLHYLRGTRPHQLKPHKFFTRGTKAQSHSVWVNPFRQKPTNNLHSIIAEEEARVEHQEKQMQLLRATGDTDALATKLKRQELYRNYPLVEPGLLEEIFSNNNYSLEATEQALEFQYDIKSVADSKQTEQAMLQEALQLSQTEHQNVKSNTEQKEFQDWEVLGYDDLRREAQIYRELASECQQKAQRYQREGMPSAGLFYRQEAKKYKAEEDGANDRAASCLVEKGSERLRKNNTLDLHSFHLNEAIKYVNMAIELKREEHQQKPDRKNTYVNIITGRGQNSKGGVPRLKPAVINHLRERNLKFEEESAGMLKVYIFPKD